MKRFLSMLFIWIVIVVLFTFFFGFFFIGVQYIYRLAVLIAVFFAVITHVFVEQSEQINELQQRIEKLEGKEK